jgi:hypothetical protein
VVVATEERREIQRRKGRVEGNRKGDETKGTKKKTT